MRLLVFVTVCLVTASLGLFWQGELFGRSEAQVKPPDSQGPPPFRSGGPTFSPFDPEGMIQYDFEREARDALRKALDRVPPERKVVLDADTVAVVGSRDPHDLFNPDKVAIGIHHIPSRTVVGLDKDGKEFARTIRGSGGAEHIAKLMADPNVRAEILRRVAR